MKAVSLVFRSFQFVGDESVGHISENVEVWSPSELHGKDHFHIETSLEIGSVLVVNANDKDFLEGRRGWVEITGRDGKDVTR